MRWHHAKERQHLSRSTFRFAAFIAEYSYINSNAKFMTILELSSGENCPAATAAYALFVVAPESENFHYSLVVKHLIHQMMQNIGAT